MPVWTLSNCSGTYSREKDILATTGSIVIASRIFAERFTGTAVMAGLLAIAFDLRFELGQHQCTPKSGYGKGSGDGKGRQ